VNRKNTKKALYYVRCEEELLMLEVMLKPTLHDLTSTSLFEGEERFKVPPVEGYREVSGCT